MKRKTIAILCVAGMLALNRTMPVMAEQHENTETLEQETGAPENNLGVAEVEEEFSYKDLKLSLIHI